MGADPLAERFNLSETQISALKEAERRGGINHVNRPIRELQGRGYLDKLLRITATGKTALRAAETTTSIRN